MTGRSIALPEFSKDRAVPSQSGSGDPQTGAQRDEELSLLIATARGAARAEGFADGVAQTESRIARDLESRITSLAATIEIAQADHSALTETMANQVHKIVSVFLDAIAPHFARTALVDEIAATLAEAMKSAPDSTLVVEVSPDWAAEIAAQLQDRNLPCRIEPDGDLTDTEAHIHWRDGLDAIDLSTAITNARAVLATHLGGGVSVNTGSLAPLFEPTESNQELTHD
ncbi:MAG: hypothetical protein AAF367_15510 [Pseudomonadota bacterium]